MDDPSKGPLVMTCAYASPTSNCVNTIPTCDPRTRLVMTCVPSLRVKSRKGLQFLAEVVQVRGSASHRSEIAGFRLGAASGGAGGFLSR